MNVSIELVSTMNPCSNRFHNFTDNYPKFDSSLSEFLKLDKITYQDKLWVCTRMMDRIQKVKYAILCAESVLHIFESKYPNDKRPREVIEHLKTYDSFDNLNQDQKNDIIKVRQAAYDAYAAAATAYYADADADAAAAAAAAAAYADAASAAASAAAAAYACAAYAYVDIAYAARKVQEEKCLQFIIQILEG